MTKLHDKNFLHILAILKSLYVFSFDSLEFQLELMSPSMSPQFAV